MSLQIEGGLFYGACPIGTILSFCKTGFAGVPAAIPQGWLECNGQAITQGVWAGNNTPNLKSKFLRGDLTSGSTGGADTHKHTLSSPDVVLTANVGIVRFATDRHIHAVSTENNIPAYYTVVYILRVI